MRVGGREVVASGVLVTHPDDGEFELTHANLIFKIKFVGFVHQQVIALCTPLLLRLVKR